jgi:predicted amidohydrolase YtcJ
LIRGALLLLFVGILGGRGLPAPQADEIFIHAHVYHPPGQTPRSEACVEEIDSQGDQPCAFREAIAVKDGKVLEVGPNEQILAEFRGQMTGIIDLKGRFVMPGFNDAHAHLASAGFEKLNVDLVGVKSLKEMKARILDHTRKAAKGEWIKGRGWDHTKWPGQNLPTRQDLDRVTKGHPAIFSRVDGHIAVANTAALKQAGIGRDTPDPDGGKIDRDALGEPTGILREGARDAVDKVMPKPTMTERRKAAELALAEAARWGVTSVQDNSPWAEFLVYEELERERKLTARITEWLPFDEPLDVLLARRAHHDVQDPWLHTGMLKGFLDGSLGSRTAALLEPYSDDPTNSGLPQYDQTTLNRMARERVARGFQLGFHAIGDRAVELALNAFEEAVDYAREHNLAHSRPEDLRLRVEHAQVLNPQQIQRFATIGVIASIQPNHLLTDMNWAERRIGHERAKASYPWKSFLENGVVLAFGTDYPVEPLTPFRGLYAAVTRENEGGTKEYFPEQRLSIDEAIRAYTEGAAYAEFAEKSKGKLLPGYWADFVVLNQDISRVRPSEILETKVLRTVVGGKTVWESE